MRQISALCVLVFLQLTTFCYAALLFNVPQEIKQPDGTVIKCLASGDEFSNRLHDTNDYTIVQNHKNGKYVYAVPDGNGLKASDYVVGQVNPSALGLTKGLQEDPAVIQARADAVHRERTAVVRDRSALGQINNIVIFVRFSDQTEFPTSKTYDSYSIDFNQTTTGATSLKAYFRAESNSQLTIDSYLYPPANGTYIVSYQDSHTRNYYCPYDATTNPTGYTTDGGTRERALLGTAITYVDNMNYVPDGLNIDQNGDGNIESVTFIIQGNTTGWNQILWPHNTVFGSSLYYINGKKATSYNVELSNAFNTGVVSHEMSHTFGFTDLYHYSTMTNVSPAGAWDIMCMNGSIPQAHLVSEKYKHGGWCPEPTLISTPGVYTLSPISTSPYAAYKIASSTTGQHYIVEYRKKEGTFESTVPGSGLIIYRINTARNGNATPPDEVWIYRPNSSDNNTNGNPENAFYSFESGRTSIHQYTSPKPYLADGTNGGLIITNIGEAGSTISFELRNTLPKIWTGSTNSGWEYSYNWVNGVPTATDDVEIPASCVRSPLITSGTCKNLTVAAGKAIYPVNLTVNGDLNILGGLSFGTGTNSIIVNGNINMKNGSELTTYTSGNSTINCLGTVKLYSGSNMSISSSSLTINGDVEIYDDVSLSTSTSVLTFNDDVIWGSGSHLTVSNSSAIINCGGSMDFMAGCNVHLTNGYIKFIGTNNSNLRVYEPIEFLNLTSKKTTPAALYVSALSTQDFNVNGDFSIETGSAFNHPSSHTMNIKGFFSNNGTYTLNAGTVRLIGTTTQYLYDYSSTSYFNNLTIATSNSAQVPVQNNLQIRGNFIIDSGHIYKMNNANVFTIGGNYTNNTSSAIFGQNSGLFVFNGSGDQVCSAQALEIFDTVELNKPGGTLIIPNNNYIHCMSLNWTAGSLRVDGGYFTALDLIDAGIFGSITLNSGTIELHQEATSYIDLRGNLTIHAGTFNVYGGISPCWFSYVDNASLTMDGGILDFKNVGIYLPSINTFTDNITGGTIKTAGGFTNDRADFNPTGGTIELYSTADCNLKNTAGSNFYNILINKGARNVTSSPEIGAGSEPDSYIGRDGNRVPITRTSGVTGIGPIVIKGSFTLSGGTLTAPETMQIAGDWTNNAGPTAFVEGIGSVEFYGTGIQNCNYSENFYTLYINNVGGELRINNSSAIITCTYYSYFTGGINVQAGTFTANDLTQSGVYGNFTAYTGATINLIQDTSQWVDIDGYLYILGGNINIYGGSLPSDWAYAANAGITMNGGTLDFKNKGVRMPLTSYSLTMNVIGGTIRANGGYEDSRTNVTYIGGTVELYGPGTGNLTLAAGSNFYDLIVNKSASRDNVPRSSEFNSSVPTTSVGKSYVATTSVGKQAEDIDYRVDGVTLSSSIYALGSLLINAGVFDTNGYSVETGLDLTVNGSFKMANAASVIRIGRHMIWNSGCTTTVSAGSFQCWGNWYFNAGSSAALANTSVLMRGTVASSVTASSASSWFYTLSFSGGAGAGYYLTTSSSAMIWNNLTVSTGTLYMQNNTTLTVANDVTLASGAGLNANGGNSMNLVIGRNWTDSNAASTEVTGFFPGNSTLTLAGSQVQTITPSASTFTVYNMIINKTAASNEVHFTKPVTVYGDCLLQQGLWMDNTNGFTHNFYQGFGVFETGTFAGGTYLSTINFTGSNPGALIFSGSGYVFNLTVSKSSVSSIVTLYSNVYALGGGSINVNVGTLDLSHYLLRTTGSVTVGNGGKLSLGTDATIEVADGKTLAVNSGGTFESLGSLEHLAKVTRQSGMFFFNINSGGTISAEYTLFEYMSTGGVYVKTGALISTVHSFHHCTFQNGGASLALLVINTDQTITINDPIFPTNTWSGTWNVRKTVNSGTINIYNATGGFSGATYEGDTYAKINWYSSIPDLVITGYSINNRTPVVGTSLYYTIYVTNNASTAISTPFRVGLYKNTASQPAVGTTPDTYITVSSLAAGATATCSFSAITSSSVTTWNTYFLADYQGVVTESDENNNGFGPQTASWQTLPIVNPPTITRVSNTVIRLDWTYSYTVTRYKIYRSTNPYSGFTQVGTSTNKYYQETAAGKYFYYVTAEL